MTFLTRLARVKLRIESKSRFHHFASTWKKQSRRLGQKGRLRDDLRAERVDSVEWEEETWQQATLNKSQGGLSIRLEFDRRNLSDYET